MSTPLNLAPLRDSRLRELADKGNAAAQAEMVKRGLAGDPAMEALRKRKKREFRIRAGWDWR